MSFPDLQLFRSLVPAAAALWLGGLGSSCVVHEVDSDPQPALGNGEEEGAEQGTGEGDGSRSASDRETRPRQGEEEAWWETFRDQELDGLVESALSRNPDLRAVERRIDQANSRLVQAGAPLFPQIDGAGDYRRRWEVDGDRNQDASLGLLLDWEIDVWGRIRSGRSARTREVEAAQEDWRAARLLLSGAVAETWFELREQRGQRRLAEDQIEVNRTLLELTRLRFGQGQSSVVDVYQQQEQLESTEARVPDIEARITELELALDSLLGRLPGRGKYHGTEDAPIVPPLWPGTGVPSDLLTERPDLRAQRARIIALDHEVGEAIAERLPRFGIGGSLGVGGSPTPEQWVGDAIAGAVGPVFDAGNRKAEVTRRRSRVREELDRYASLFLVAVRDVETALARERGLDQRILRQEAQLKTARKLLVESKNRYTLGATDYLPVLDAVAKVQELERDLLTSHRERFSARTFLHRALGGPMPEPRSPIASQP